MAALARITPAPSFKTAFAAYNAAVALRDLCHTDDEIERAEAAVEPLFDAVVTHPTPDMSTIISKCSAIVTEYGQGDIPAYLVEAIMFDLIALEYRA